MLCIHYLSFALYFSISQNPFLRIYKKDFAIFLQKGKVSHKVCYFTMSTGQVE